MLAGVGCTTSIPPERQRMNAPTSAEDVGVLLEGATHKEIITLLNTYPAARVRNLNPEHGLYEIFGLSQEQVQSQSGGRADANVYLQMQSEGHRGSNTWQLMANSPVGTKIDGFETCAEGPAPEAKLEAIQPSVDLNGSVIELGQTVRVVNRTDRTQIVRSALFVIVPQASMDKSRNLQEVTEFEFKPDALGAYMLALAVQNDKNVCGLKTVRFVVTADRPYVGPNVPAPQIDLSTLTHLRQISAEASWNLSEGEGLVIAVIDSGVNYNHPALASAIQINGQEIPGNLRDDDGNGFVDDVLGYDFVNGDAFPYDDDGHGSHVAGLAAGRPFGLARKAKILPIKAMNGQGGDVGSIAAGIRYAVDRGARIINLSLGGAATSPPPPLVSAMNYAEKKSVLVIVAAGNGESSTGLGLDIDKIPIYPASLKNPNMLVVGAFDAENSLSVYSNFGAESVDIIAPGGIPKKDPVLSATAENPRQELIVGMVGTSMAAPMVSGMAAQVWSRSPELSLAQVREILLQAGPTIDELKPVCVSGRHIDALSVLQSRHVSF